MPSTTLPPTLLPGNIREQFASIRAQSRLRHRDIAAQLLISEGALIAAHAVHFNQGGVVESQQSDFLRAMELGPSWSLIMSSLMPLGEVMALTRNEACVHEKIGVHHGGAAASVLNPVYPVWARGFAVHERHGKSEQRSLQFFDAKGLALHKVFLTQSSHTEAYNELVLQFAAGLGCDDAAPVQRVNHHPKGRGAVPEVVDIVPVAPPDFALDLSPFILALLQEVADQQLPILIEVGNVGAVQKHEGIIKKVVAMGPWLNVLDASFSLHLRSTQVTHGEARQEALVLKDAQGDEMACLGLQEKNQPAVPAWQKLKECFQTSIRSEAPCF